MIFHSIEGRRWLEAEVLPGYVRRSRWFGGKARAVEGVKIAEVIPFRGDACLALVEVRYPAGVSEIYQVPLQHAARAEMTALITAHPGALIAAAGEMVLIDALFAPAFRAELWERITASSLPAPSSHVLSAEQSNSSLLFGEKVFVKVFRRIECGVNPDAEILRFLTEERHFPHVPAFVGALEWPAAKGENALLAIAIAAVPNRGDAWTFALAELKEFYARTQGDTPRDGARIRETVGEHLLGRIAQLGARTGELHVTLAGFTTNPDFAPEPLTAADFVTLQQNVLSLWEEVIASVPDEHTAALDAATPNVRQRAGELAACPITATKTRTHGDYHLGQVLETGDDFVIIDFEGEPARSLAERRRKQSPARDVAGMLRSLHYAAHAARPDDAEPTLLWAEAWTALTTRTFLDAWTDATRGASFRPASDSDLDFLVNAFLLEKAIYEIRYELNNRPTWLPIPLRGLQRVLSGR